VLRDFAPYIITGIVAGSLYGLAATGLVLTYKTSGIFNFAHGAVGAGAAYVFYSLHDEAGMPSILAAVITCLVVAPVLGLLLSLLATRLAEASTAKRVVATVGVLLVIQGMITVRFGAAPRTTVTTLPNGTFKVAGVFIGYDQVITTAIAFAAVALLEVLFRYSRLGLQMRAVVDNAELLDLAWQSPLLVRAKAWMIGSIFAAVSGILLAPTVGLDAIVLTLIVVQAFGAAAVGRFERTTATFFAGIGIGILQYLDQAPKIRSFVPFGLAKVTGIEQAIPFLVLFGVLIFTRKGTFNERTVKRSGRVAPPFPTALRNPVMALTGLALIMAPIIYHTKLPVFTMGAVFVTIYASLFLLTEVSNQVSLCHVTFVAIGATTFCHLTSDVGLPWLLGVIGAGLVALPVGAIVAIPAIRLSGAFLALATLGFGILVEKLFYSQDFMFGGFGTLSGHRPDLLGLDTNRGYYYLCLTFGIAAIGTVLLVRRSRLGRLLSGLADSPIAVATHGSNVSVIRVMVFCLSAFLAGMAGALYVGVIGQVSSSGASPSALISFNSLLWLAVLALVGRNAFIAPLLAAGALVVGPSYISDPGISQYLTLGFGLTAIISAAFGDSIAKWIAVRGLTGAERTNRGPVQARWEPARG
jgi:branched-subunit amino acid ABC-type transport system permease component